MFFLYRHFCQKIMSFCRNFCQKDSLFLPELLSKSNRSFVKELFCRRITSQLFVKKITGVLSTNNRSFVKKIILSENYDAVFVKKITKGMKQKKTRKYFVNELQASCSQKVTGGLVKRMTWSCQGHLLLHVY